eukprot:COSAG06_NODE_770_length_12437_cov_27.452423_8_plen_129_part_00
MQLWLHSFRSNVQQVGDLTAPIPSKAPTKSPRELPHQIPASPAHPSIHPAISQAAVSSRCFPVAHTSLSWQNNSSLEPSSNKMLRRFLRLDNTANCIMIDHFSAFEPGLVAPFLYAACKNGWVRAKTA